MSTRKVIGWGALGGIEAGVMIAFAPDVDTLLGYDIEEAGAATLWGDYGGVWHDGIWRCKTCVGYSRELYIYCGTSGTIKLF